MKEQKTLDIKINYEGPEINDSQDAKLIVKTKRRSKKPGGNSGANRQSKLNLIINHLDKID